MEQPTKGRYRGEEIYLADALMQLTRDELYEVEATREDGTTFRPYRDFDPEFRRDKDGILSF